MIKLTRNNGHTVYVDFSRIELMTVLSEKETLINMASGNWFHVTETVDQIRQLIDHAGYCIPGIN